MAGHKRSPGPETSGDSFDMSIQPFSILFSLLLLTGAMASICTARARAKTEPWQPVPCVEIGVLPQFRLAWKWYLIIYGSIGLAIGALVKLCVLDMLVPLLRVNDYVSESGFFFFLISASIGVMIYGIAALWAGMRSGRMNISLSLALGVFVCAILHLSFFNLLLT
jgi:hypothetical protein